MYNITILYIQYATISTRRGLAASEVSAKWRQRVATARKAALIYYAALAAAIAIILILSLTIGVPERSDAAPPVWVAGAFVAWILPLVAFIYWAVASAPLLEFFGLPTWQHYVVAIFPAFCVAIGWLVALVVVLGDSWRLKEVARMLSG